MPLLAFAFAFWSVFLTSLFLFVLNPQDEYVFIGYIMLSLLFAIVLLLATCIIALIGSFKLKAVLISACFGFMTASFSSLVAIAILTVELGVYRGEDEDTSYLRNEIQRSDDVPPSQ